jgi:hypothetical protein
MRRPRISRAAKAANDTEGSLKRLPRVDDPQDRGCGDLHSQMLRRHDGGPRWMSPTGEINMTKTDRACLIAHLSDLHTASQYFRPESA